MESYRKSIWLFYSNSSENSKQLFQEFETLGVDVINLLGIVPICLDNFKEEAKENGIEFVPTMNIITTAEDMQIVGAQNILKWITDLIEMCQQPVAENGSSLSKLEYLPSADVNKVDKVEEIGNKNGSDDAKSSDIMLKANKLQEERNAAEKIDLDKKMVPLNRRNNP